MMIGAEWINSESATAITEEQLKSCIKEKAPKTVDETQLDNINAAIKDIKMSKVRDAEDRV